MIDLFRVFMFLCLFLEGVEVHTKYLLYDH